MVQIFEWCFGFIRDSDYMQIWKFSLFLSISKTMAVIHKKDYRSHKELSALQSRQLQLLSEVNLKSMLLLNICITSHYIIYILLHHSFHCSVLKDDLRPFKNGISEGLMADTVHRGVGTHYQIISKKLYREQSCMFPARFVKYFFLTVKLWSCHGYGGKDRNWEPLN